MDQLLKILLTKRLEKVELLSSKLVLELRKSREKNYLETSRDVVLEENGEDQMGAQSDERK